MKKDIEEWFAEQDFNTESLPEGHRNRFLDKLNEACEDAEELHVTSDISSESDTTENSKVIQMKSWFKWSLVAGLAILVGFAGMNIAPAPVSDHGLSTVSPEMAQAQDFFTNTIHQELEQLDKLQSPDTERIIIDTKNALNKLEEDYKLIKEDFKINKDSKTVIAAMIQNFQNRIDLLETALEQIEQLKNYKEQENEAII